MKSSKKKHGKLPAQEAAKQEIKNTHRNFATYLKENKWTRWLTGTLAVTVAAIISIYYFSVINYSSNFPWFDDYDSILKFIADFNTKTSIYDKVVLLLSQHNEHRIVFGRAIILLQYYLIHQVNFAALIIVGNISLLLILWILSKSILYKQKIHPVFLLPIVLLVINFRYYEIIFWATASLTNLWVLVFVLTSLFFLFQDRRYSIYLAILFGLLASFSLGNGMFTFAAGAIVLLFNRRFFTYQTLLWIASGIVIVAAYFYGYEKPPAHPAVLKTIQEQPLLVLSYFVSFMGNCFSRDSTVTLIAGTSILLFIILITVKKYYKVNPVIYSYIIFLILTAAATTLTRAGFGSQQALASRYIINTSILLACCYLVILSLTYQRINFIHFLVIIGLSGFFHFSTYYFLQLKIIQKRDFDKNYALITTGRFSAFHYGWPLEDLTKPKEIIRAADSLGIFKFKFEDENDVWKKIYSIPNSLNLPYEYHIDRVEQGEDKLMHVDGWAFIRNLDSDSTICSVFLKNSQNIIVAFYMCSGNERGDIAKIYKSDRTNHLSCGFTCSFNLNSLESGRYRVGIQITDSKSKIEIDTDNWFNVSRN